MAIMVDQSIHFLRAGDSRRKSDEFMLQLSFFFFLFRTIIVIIYDSILGSLASFISPRLCQSPL